MHRVWKRKYIIDIWGHCGHQEMVPKYPCWLDFPWLRPKCGCWAEPRLGIQYEPGLLLQWLNSSSLSCFCYGDCLSIKTKSWKVWSDLPSLPLKWSHLSRFHRDHILITITDVTAIISISDFSAVILILTARATERTQIWLSSSFALLLSCTKCCRFWKMSNVWWMFPKVECILNVKLRWNNFFFVRVCVFNFFNEVPHQAP